MAFGGSFWGNQAGGTGGGGGGSTTIFEPGGPPTVVKYDIDVSQVFATTEDAWRSLTFNETATEEQENEGGGITAASDAITLKPATYNIVVIVTVAEQDDNRRAFAIRLVDEDGNVLEDYPSTTYMRGVGGDFNDRTRLQSSFNSVIIASDTTFSIQSAAVEVEDSTPQTVNVWATAPGGTISVTKVAVGARGERGDPGETGSGSTVASDATLTGTGAVGSELGVADGSISTDKIQDNAVTEAKVADNAIGTSKLKDDAVTADKIAAGVIPTVPDAPGQATEGEAGVAEIATTGEAAAGTDDTKIMTPLKSRQQTGALATQSEVDAGTSTAIKKFSPALVKRAAEQHGGSSTPGAPSYARNEGAVVNIGASQTAAVATGTNIDRTFDSLIDRFITLGSDNTNTTLTMNVADNADLTQYNGRRMTFKNDARNSTARINLVNTSPANMRFVHGNQVESASFQGTTIDIGYRQAVQLLFTTDRNIHILYNQSGVELNELKNRVNIGFDDHLKAAGREYAGADRTRAENAVWNTFDDKETISGTLFIGSELATARTRRRLEITSGSAVAISASSIESTLDGLADNVFPIRILVRRTQAGNITLARTGAITQDALTSGNVVFGFTANQVRELVITRLGGTSASNYVYGLNMIDGISADTMIERGEESGAGFRALAYLFDRYFHLYRGLWSSGGYYKTADIVSNRARLFIAFADNGPSALEPYRSTNWHPLDANVSYRGPFLPGSARYKTGDITLDNGVLFILITGSLTNSNTLPSADPTNWVPLNQQAASQAEVNTGLNTSKFVNPATLKARLASFGGGGGITGVDMTNQVYLRLEADGQTVASATTTSQVNKAQAERRDIILAGAANSSPNAIRLVISTQGQNAAYWNGVEFVISNGTDTDISHFAIASGTGDGGVITGSNIITIPSLRRALVKVSESSAATISSNGLTISVKLIDGAPGTGGTVNFATFEQAKGLSDTSRSLNPHVLGQLIETHARAAGVAGRTKMAIDRIMDAIEHADNAGNIDPITGFDLMGLFFTTRTDIGHGNEQWVFGRCDNVLELRSIQVGADDNPNRTHNYVLVLKDNAVRHNHILNPLDIDNLIGIAFPQYPASPSAGDELVHRMTFGWAANSDAPFTRNPNAVDITVPRKKTADTRTITGILVRAGRVSGITDTSTLAEIFDATTADSAVFHEVVIPIWGSRHQAVAGTATIQTVYRVFFADGVHISIRVNEALADNGQVVIEADVNHATNVVLDGTEAISFHAIRSIGG